MQLHTINVFYRRQSQPAQYEAEEARLEGSVTVEEGEDFEAVAYDLLTRARVQAHRALGLKVPAIAEFLPANGEEGGVEFVLPSGGPGEPIEQPKRKRRTKAEMEAARAAEANPTEAGENASGAEFDPTAEVPTTKAAEPNDDDIMAELNGAAVIDDKTIQAEAAAASRKSSASAVKAIMAEFGVARLGDMAQEKRAGFLERIKALG